MRPLRLEQRVDQDWSTSLCVEDQMLADTHERRITKMDPTMVLECMLESPPVKWTGAGTYLGHNRQIVQTRKLRVRQTGAGGKFDYERRRR